MQKKSIYICSWVEISVPEQPIDYITTRSYDTAIVWCCKVFHEGKNSCFWVGSRFRSQIWHYSTDLAVSLEPRQSDRFRWFRHDENQCVCTCDAALPHSVQIEWPEAKIFYFITDFCKHKCLSAKAFFSHKRAEQTVVCCTFFTTTRSAIHSIQVLKFPMGFGHVLLGVTVISPEWRLEQWNSHICLYMCKPKAFGDMRRATLERHPIFSLRTFRAMLIVTFSCVTQNTIAQIAQKVCRVLSYSN